MDFPIQSEGLLQASYEKGLYRIALDVDPGIAEVARALLPKYIRAQKPKYAPHMSVVRQEEPLPLGWTRFQGETVNFMYSTEVFFDETYYWLAAESPRLRAIRIELGLEELGWCCRPPDQADWFHITFANRKG